MSIMKKILAIDDDSHNLLLIKAVLTKNISDCTVDTALSGAEGIEIARELMPDSILLDILMPGINGFETCRILKNDEKTKHIPVLLVSALGQNYENRIKGLNMGADAFITKPFESPELVSQVKVLLRIKNAEDLLRKQNKELKNSIDEINSYQLKLKKMNAELHMVEEKERRRIAEYLHDGIGQILSLAHINLSALLRKELLPDVQKTIRAASGFVNDAIVQSRLLTYDLSPPILYELGLIPAIKWKLNQTEINHKINTILSCSLPKLEMSINDSILIYRIVCELLTNVTKHANASSVEVQIKKDKDFYYFSVNDNGKGFNYDGKSTLMKNGGFGLFSINERLDSIQGHLLIESELKKGTKTTISIPAKNI